MEICLMLHGLGPPPPHVAADEAAYWLTTETFARVLDLVRQTHNHVRITFDDGNVTDARIALPALREAGLSAAFFIPSDRIGETGYLSEGDIRELRAAGMEIGSHGCAHIRWPQVPSEVVAEDVTRSIARLSSILGEKIETAAVPFGDCNLRVLRVLRTLGMRRVYTSFRGPSRDGAWLVRRDCLTAGMSQARIRELITKTYTAVDGAISFLRMWRHAGPASNWPAT
ncbi:MAG: polysaccharide deacetylase family protein [Alphaproteobacteria bacterium]|nr:polysaccharide deacetylase family protein [Alphaproteobacteria bacterium]MDE2629723.1 polysaccharide deacetylase family protein [Alphaproteobacteria bacterium]